MQPKIITIELLINNGDFKLPNIYRLPIHFFIHIVWLFGFIPSGLKIKNGIGQIIVNRTNFLVVVLLATLIMNLNDSLLFATLFRHIDALMIFVGSETSFACLIKYL